MAEDIEADVAAAARISAIPTILNVVCRTTGMGFAAVARVTEGRWVACSVRDDIAFGLKSGGELKVETTICNEVREHNGPVVINHVAEDEFYFGHPTPKLYGFQSYISMPIVLTDGRFFGTLCAIDPRPHVLDAPETIGMFKLFAELIAFYLDANDRVAVVEHSLRDERATAELREQFIAVLGHDLRNPLASIDAGTLLLQRTPLNERAASVVAMMHTSVTRMSKLIENVLDLALGRLGGGLKIDRADPEPLEPVLARIVDETLASWPGRIAETTFDMAESVPCDRGRVSQLLSNLMANALTYGDPSKPVRVRAGTPDDHFELSVANSGNPIPSETLNRLFQPYFRGDVRSDQKGLGLGLYIAAEVARAHGGTIAAVSDNTETRFTFRMKLDPS